MIKYMDFVKQVIKTSQTLYARDTGSQGYLPRAQGKVHCSLPKRTHYEPVSNKC